MPNENVLPHIKTGVKLQLTGVPMAKQIAIYKTHWKKI